MFSSTQAREALEPYLKEGKDILYIAFSSGLSGTYNSIRMAAEELQEEYPERKLIVIDSLCACMGEGLLVYKAVQFTMIVHVDNRLDLDHRSNNSRSL